MKSRNPARLKYRAMSLSTAMCVVYTSVGGGGGLLASLGDHTGV